MIEDANYALILTAISLLYFFYLGFRASFGDNNSEHFWFADREIDESGLFHTWSISTISFAVGILYYMQVVYIWGYWIFFGSLLTYALGQFIALWIATSPNIDLTKFNTIGCFLEIKTGNKNLGRFVDFLNFIAAWALVYIELGLGVKVVSSLFSDSNIVFEIFVLLVLCATIYSYISFGGFTAIVASDRWQSRIVWIGTGAFVFFSFYLGSENIQEGKPIFDFAPSATNETIISYILFALLVNLSFTLPQAAIWQRLASSSNQKNRFWMSLKGIIVATTIFCIYIIIAGIYKANGLEINTPEDIFLPVFEIGKIGTQIVFPLLFTAFISAMISTADSSAIAGIYSLFAYKRPEDTENISDKSWKKTRFYSQIMLAVMLGAVVIIYSFFELFHVGFAGTFLEIIFYLYAQLTVATPVILGCVLFPKRLRSSNTIFYGVVFGWVVLTSTTISHCFGEGISGNLWATVVGVIITFIATFRFTKNPNPVNS